jgi:lipoprotein LprG
VRILRRPARTRALALVLATAFPVMLAGCGGSSSPGEAPSAALADAKKTFDATSGVEVQLDGSDLPDGNVLVSARGTLTRAPAFDGTISVKILGATANVPVVAVDGKVYAKLPLTTSWQTIDPADYGVPDPATLISPQAGISNLLTATKDPKAGDSVRGGKDNKEVLTTFTGTLPGSAVASIISSATGDFDVAYTIDGDHQLSQAKLTGKFYGADQATSTYTVTLDDYGTDKTISKP